MDSYTCIMVVKWLQQKAPAKTQISLDIATVESLLSAWTNVLADLSLVGLQAHFVGLNFHELAQIYENDNSNDKNYYDTLNNVNTWLF